MKFWKYKKSLFLLFVAAGMTGCVQEYGGEEILTPPSGNEVTITVNIPGQRIPTTRSIADGGGEAAVAFIDLLVFGSDGTLTEYAAGQIVSQSELGAENYKVTFKAPLAVNADARMVVIAANLPAATISAAAKVGDAKEDILKALTHITTGKWLAGDPYTPIPMYGEAAVASGISSGMTIENIELTRMLARIDVVNNASGFTLSEVYLVNYNTAGYAAPAWGTGGVLAGSLPATPMIPASNVVNTGEANALKYIYSGALLGEIYTYEAAATSGNEGAATHTNAACLIVKGKYGGTDYYYRIDFTDGKDTAGKVPGAAGFDPASVGYMPVYRNHLYMFDIEAVNGVGFPATPAGFEAARQSLGVLNNLKTTLHVVDQSGIKNMVFNGEHYIGVNRTEYNVSYEGSLGNELVIYTNAKDLKAVLTATGGWMTMGTLQHVSGDRYAITFDVSENLTYEERTGKITLTAGRLNLSVQCNYSIAPLFARSNIVLKDGKLTFAVTEADNTTIPANSQGLHFKWGSLVGINSTGTHDLPFAKEHVVFCPSEFTKPTIWIGGIPCCDMDNGEYNIELDAFMFFYPVTGYKASEGKGDICRYISDKGWVAGRWRMPTSAEYKKLYDETTVTAKIGTFSDDPYETISVATGFHRMQSGRWLGRGVTAAIMYNTANMTSPPDATVFLPAAGSRYNNDGMLKNTGVGGSYWSTSPGSADNKRFLFFNSNSVVPSSYVAHRNFGYTVRCIVAR